MDKKGPPPSTIYNPSSSQDERPYPQAYYRPDDTDTINWCYNQQKNKPQSNSVAGPLMVMLVSGVHIGWGIASPQLRGQEWHLNTLLHEQVWTICSWYIGAFLGSIFTIFIYTKFTKREIYYLSGGLCLLSSGLFMGFPQHMLVLLFVRLIAGFAHGFTYITGICHASENCVKEIRGILISCFHYTFIVSVFTAVIITAQSKYESGGYFEFNILLGGLCVLYTLMGLAFTPCFTYESIVYLIQRQKYGDAIHNMMKLRNESVETWQIKNDFDEMKLMVAEDVRTSPSIIKDGNTRPLLLIILTRIVAVLGLNYAINMIRDEAIAPLTGGEWSATVIYSIRMAVVTIVLFFADAVGRKILLTVSSGGTAICTILYGIFRETITNNDVVRSIPIFGFDIFASIGMCSIPDVLISEAFPITKKILSMVVSTCVEYLLQIIIIVTTYGLYVNQYATAVVFTFGAVLLIITVFLFYNLPETRVMSLRQARSEFRKKNDDTTFNREQQPPNVNSYYS